MEVAANVTFFESGSQGFRCIILANNSDEPSCDAQARKVDSNIGRSTRPVVRFLDVNDWNWRLR
jgi:hypothetical protein